MLTVEGSDVIILGTADEVSIAATGIEDVTIELVIGVSRDCVADRTADIDVVI